MAWEKRCRAFEKQLKSFGVIIKNFQAVYPFKGYVTETVNCTGIGIKINLRRDRRCRLKCPDCGHKMAVNRTPQSIAYDLSWGAGKVVVIKYPITQGKCSSCPSCSSFRPAEIHPTRHATWRLMRYVSLLSRHVPFEAMPMLIEVPKTTAYRYDLDVLKADLPEPDFDGIRAILIDGKAVHKGHGYVTCVPNADTGELLHLHEGKKKASLEAFFDKLTVAQSLR